MLNDETIFEKNYNAYLSRIEAISFESIAVHLGAEVADDTLILEMFTDDFTVSTTGIKGPSGEKPSYDICVILCKYMLMCPETPPQNGDWVGYRDFKDSGPLGHYFSSAVEGAIGSHFSGQLKVLKEAATRIGGFPPGLDIQCDLAVQLNALPMVPLIVLFNDADEEFPATCSILFERRAQDYLDAECLAMLGYQLAMRLKE